MKALLDILAAVGDPTRLRILLLLRDVELAMGELADVLDQSQPRVSRHVRILADAGLVRRSKEGAWVFVSLHEGAPLDQLFSFIDAQLAGELPATQLAQDRARLAQVRSARQRALDEWFAANAAEWDMMTALEGKAAPIDSAVLATARAGGVGRLLDIGTGTGRLLAELAAEARSIAAVDRSPEMLRLARSRLGQTTAPAAEMRQADMLALPFADHSFDTILLHQVLHFSEDPQAALAEAARVLAPGGKMVIADHAPHDHEALRQQFRHRRLGFDSTDMLRWLGAVGLTASERSRHPGPELETILWEARA